ncbi:MAG: glycerol kinase [Gammaproteobacteria bacterium]|jgi:glycerol kinase
MTKYILAIDQGTTSSRAMLFDQNYRVASLAQQEFSQHYPNSGWVEHDPEEIWQTTIESCRKSLAELDLSAGDIAAIGITNQRETTVVWDRNTGKAIYPAIVWQDRRTSEYCKNLKQQGLEADVTEKTGLLLDPYFSATKLAWILDHVDGARAAAGRGELAFGTIDCFLLWRLTAGAVHATDATNASRTMLFDIRNNRWSEELLELFNIPASLLPEVKNCADDFGQTDAQLFDGRIKICGIAGDQQAATIGQACFQPGMMKSTYGTGCFALLNTGSKMVTSSNRLLTTIAYRLDNQISYALEGSIFVAGAGVQWLRDELAIIDSAEESGDLAAASDEDQSVYLVPAFVGLGAPYWDADCRAALYGMSRGTGRAEIVRATLESVCFQTGDLLEAMRQDWPSENQTILRVDGGMANSDWTMQRLADLVNAEVDRPEIVETTALGAAWLAGYGCGFYDGIEGFSQNWALDQRFTPTMDNKTRKRKIEGWKDAVRRTLSHYPAG